MITEICIFEICKNMNMIFYEVVKKRTYSFFFEVSRTNTKYDMLFT